MYNDIANGMNCCAVVGLVIFIAWAVRTGRGSRLLLYLAAMCILVLVLAIFGLQ